MVERGSNPLFIHFVDGYAAHVFFAVSEPCAGDCQGSQSSRSEYVGEEAVGVVDEVGVSEERTHSFGAACRVSVMLPKFSYFNFVV